MDLFDSSQPALGSFRIEPKEEHYALSTLLASDPLSIHYVAPAGDSPRDLVRYLIACQQATYGCFTDIPYEALFRGVKRLLVKHSPDTIKRATKLASLWSSTPFTWKFVRERTIPEVERHVEAF